MTGKDHPSALAQQLGTFFVAQTVAEMVEPVAPRPRIPQLEKRTLAGQLLATLSPEVLAESGYLERRGGDRSGADPRSLYAGRLRHAAARTRHAR